MRIEMGTLDLMKRNQRSFKLGALYLISRLYKCVVRLRNGLYNMGLLPLVKAKVPVISVGNITAGGTGKTPFVMMLLESLGNKRVATLTRGYRKESKSEGKVDDPKMGDEAYMMAQHFDHIYSVKDRAQFASKLEGFDLIVLDDGFQHRQLKRECDVVCMRRSDLFGQGYYLPRGLLRDDPKRLRDADLICVSEVKHESDMEKVKKKLAPYTSAPMIGVQFVADGVETLDGEPVDNFDLKVGVFCGLGHPGGFIASVKFPYVATLILPDHAPIDEDEIVLFSKKCAQFGAKGLVCSEKDSVKCLQFSKVELPIFVQKGKLKITYGINEYNRFIGRYES